MRRSPSCLARVILLLLLLIIGSREAMAIGDFSVSSAPSILTVQHGASASSSILISSGVFLPIISCADYIVSVTSSPPGFAFTLAGTHFCLATNQQATSNLTINPPSSATLGTYDFTVTVSLCTSPACTSFSLVHTVTIALNIVAPAQAQPKWWGGWASLGGPPNVTVSSQAVGKNQDGRLEVFIVGGDGNLWHIWQVAPNDNWSSWGGLGGPPGVTVSSPAVAQNQDGRLEVFSVGSDGNLWHIWQVAPNDGWSSWGSLGSPPGVTVSSPAVALNQDGHLEVFAVASDGNLWRIWQAAPNDGWSSWGSLGAPPNVTVSSPTVTQNQDQRLEAFVAGSDGSLWHIWQAAANDGWSSWGSLDRPPNVTVALPTATQNQDGRLEVFVAGSDGSLWHIWQAAVNDGWSSWGSWGSPPGAALSSPAAAQNQDGHLEVYGHGADGAVWYNTQVMPNDGWCDWRSLGSGLTRGPVTGRNADGRLEAFAVGNDNALWHTWQSTQTVVWTQHNDNSRSGLNEMENTLTPAPVNSPQFGLLFTIKVDERIYAQPLYLGNLIIPNKGQHNVVYVATANNSVYAIDADHGSPPLWVVNLTPAGETPVQARPGPSSRSSSDVGTSSEYGPYADMYGNIGIIGTPVIDIFTSTLYVVARTKNNSGAFFQRLYALDIFTGQARPGWPVTISASVLGSNENGPGQIVFNPRTQNQRAALLLWRGPAGSTTNPVVFISWSSHADDPPYHGWIIGYDTVTRERVAVFNTTPNIQEMLFPQHEVHAGGGSIWQAGQGPAADVDGNIYVMTGNGDFNESLSNFGSSILKLRFDPVTRKVRVADFLTPHNWESLNYWDSDLGSAGALLLPGTDLVMGGGKEGWIYTLKRSSLGHVEPSDHSIGFQAVFNPSLGSLHIHGSPVSWMSPSDGTLAYVWGENDVIRAFRYNRSTDQFNANTYAQGDVPTANVCIYCQYMPGAMLSLSSNGCTPGTGIVWASLPWQGKDAEHEEVPGRLIAFDATASNGKINVLWRSDKVPGYTGASSPIDATPSFTFAKFAYPTIANGKVYLPTFSNELRVYGLQ